MDSQCFNQTATEMNGYNHNNAVIKIDLTLKLGLPNGTDHENQRHANLDTDSLSSHVGINHYKMMQEGMNNFSNIGQSFNPNEVAWPPSNFGNRYSHAKQVHSKSGYGFSPFPGSSHDCNFNMNPCNNLQPAATFMKHYTLIDVPSTRGVDHRELGFVGSSSTAASARWRAAGNLRRQQGGSINIDPFKRCTNYNCNTNDTPMWRKGPLGPKTLCNACGIKYRKEVEKKKPKEANKSNADQDSNTQTA